MTTATGGVVTVSDVIPDSPNHDSLVEHIAECEERLDALKNDTDIIGNFKRIFGEATYLKVVENAEKYLATMKAHLHG